MAAEEAAALGIDPVALGLTGEAAQADEEGGLWPWHLPALEAWLRVAGQLKAVVVGGGLARSRLLWLGLDAAGARAALEMAGTPLVPGLWDELQAIAAGAAEELNRS